jgi:UDP-N-acetylglucosamine 4,6-dehydratase/5-epimerase
LNEKRILITGGAGYLGSHFVRKLLKEDASPVQLIVFSRDELKHFDLKIAVGENPKLKFVIGDVRDAERLAEAMKQVDVVIHAGAMKHVDICEANPSECIKTNIHGTENVIRAAQNTNVSQLILISTDKAVEPLSVYGNSKQVSERLVMNANSESMQTTILRFGNLIGSTGSIVDKIRKSKSKQKFQLYNQEATRFADNLANAWELLSQAMSGKYAGCVLIPKLQALNVKDLAHCLFDEVQSVCREERPFEKLHEKLVSSKEAEKWLENEKFYIIPPAKLSEDQALEKYRSLPSLRKTYSSDTTDKMSMEEIHKALGVLQSKKV